MNVTSLLAIALGAILVNNFILVAVSGHLPLYGRFQKDGYCPGHGRGGHLRHGRCLGGDLVQWTLYPARRLGLGYMQTVAFILVIAALVQLVEMFLQKSVPALYQALGIYLPLITTNCAVLGVALLNIQEHYNFIGVSGLWLHRRPGLYPGHRPVLPRSASGLTERGVPRELSGISHCSDFRRALLALAFMGFSGLRIF